MFLYGGGVETLKGEWIKQFYNESDKTVLTGGFPCQDISTAGKGKGIGGERSGLWNEMWRVIREIRPEYVVIENSPALLIRGFEQVLCDLSKIGYMCEWDVLQANWFGADHQRKRLYAVAYPYGSRQQAFLQQLNVNIEKKKNWKASSPKFIIPNEWHDRQADNFIIRRGDGISNKLHRIKGLGNAIVPDIAHEIFKLISA